MLYQNGNGQQDMFSAFVAAGTHQNAGAFRLGKRHLDCTDGDSTGCCHRAEIHQPGAAPVVGDLIERLLDDGELRAGRSKMRCGSLTGSGNVRLDPGRAQSGNSLMINC